MNSYKYRIILNQKLPQNVIKDGKAIPIRSEIEKFFNPA